MLTGLDAAQLIREGWIPVRGAGRRARARRGRARAATGAGRVHRADPGAAGGAQRHHRLGRPAGRAVRAARATYSTGRRSACGAGPPRSRPGSTCTRGSGSAWSSRWSCWCACAWRWPWGTLQAVSVTIAFGFPDRCRVQVLRLHGGRAARNATRRSPTRRSPRCATTTCRSTPCSCRCSARPRWCCQLVGNLASSTIRRASSRSCSCSRRTTTETIERREAAGLPACHDRHGARTGSPQTKPKACNYGLSSRRGEYS